MRALRSFVILEKLPEENKTEGGLVVPGKKDKFLRAKVVSRGPGERIHCQGYYYDRIGFEVGDTVLVMDIRPLELREGGKEYWVVHDDDVVAVLERGKDGPDTPPSTAG